ncbi:KilA-N domain-containing protein [Acinetobacter sichuanensis]|uniref:KilA-N domain-containing protein n=1 Tax=Acinetobacter sichuanensis TaxID=2136183 RepID=UPI00280EDB6F|nr:KilA-N domain-containing protein [Acinetobacter sichuanensis]MDQ9021758.1 KilA-N domain-containing protein [Acinetobacter sichuanensis]
MKGLIISQYNGQNIGCNESSWVNATQAAKPFDKRSNDWLNLTKTKSYIQAMCEYMAINEPKSLIKIKHGNDTVTSQNGNAQVNWLDSCFSVWCDIQIGHPIFDKRRLRHQTASTYKTVSTVLKLSR